MIPVKERLKILGDASLSYGNFWGKIYNGSSWTISNITFQVIAIEKDGSLRWNRRFNKSIKISPLSTSRFSISVSGAESIGSFDWYFDEILGFKISK